MVQRLPGGTWSTKFLNWWPRSRFVRTDDSGEFRTELGPNRIPEQVFSNYKEEKEEEKDQLLQVMLGKLIPRKDRLGLPSREPITDHPFQVMISAEGFWPAFEGFSLTEDSDRLLIELKDLSFTDLDIRVKNNAAESVEGARVRIRYGVFGDPHNSHSVDGFTSRLGTFETDVIEGGEIQVSVEKEGYKTFQKYIPILKHHSVDVALIGSNLDEVR